MTWSASQLQLEKAVVTAARGANSRGEMDLLRLWVKDGQLHVLGASEEMVITRTCPVNGDDGEIIVGSKLFREIVRKLDDDLATITPGKGRVEVSDGSVKYDVRTVPAEAYPYQTIAPPEDDVLINLNAADFSDAIRRVVPVASTDENRPTLCAVFIETDDTGTRFVATDGASMGVLDVETSVVPTEITDVLVPARALGEVRHIVEKEQPEVIRLGFERSYAFFEIGDTSIRCRLIAEQFPAYRSLIPEIDANRLTLSRTDLLDILDKISILAESEATPIRITPVDSDQILMQVQSPEFGDAEQICNGKWEGDEFTVAFRIKYLTTGAEAFDCDEITLDLKDAKSPSLIKGRGDDSFLYVVVPQIIK